MLTAYILIVGILILIFSLIPSNKIRVIQYKFASSIGTNIYIKLIMGILI